VEHIGIDVHKKESQLCILTEAGEVIERRIHTECTREARPRLGDRAIAAIEHEASPAPDFVRKKVRRHGCDPRPVPRQR
jgi:hypothetical protein